MGTFEIQRSTRLPSIAPLPRANMNVDTGEGAIGQAVAGVGQTLKMIGEKRDQMTDANSAVEADLYTVPAGSNGIVEYIILREPSATLAGCSDVNFGVGAGTTGSWIDAESGIADMTAVTDYMVLERTDHISNEFTVIDGDDATANNRTFGIYIVAGATSAAATVTIDVFGYIF